MKTLISLAVLVASTTAFAQPTPSFSTATSFESCTRSWAFACNKRDSQGNTFGTAHEMTHCQKYTFQPNGTYTINGGPTSIGGGRGTYRMIGATVRITPINDDGTSGKPFDLVLSPDGGKLGEMKRKP